MRPRPLLSLLFAAGLFAAVLTATVLAPSPRPRADEATYTLAALSLWFDRDLAWDHRDLDRGLMLWSEGPAGVALRSPAADGELPRFAVSPALPLAAAPWAGLFGAGSLRWLHAALYCAMFVAAGWLGRRELGDASARGAIWFWLGSFAASVALLFAARSSPAIPAAACLFVPLAVGVLLRREGDPRGNRRAAALLALAGFAAGSAVHSQPLWALLALPLAADLAARRRVRELGVFAGAALVTFGLWAGLSVRWAGAWLPAQAGGEAAIEVYEEHFPGEPRAALPAARAGEAVSPAPARWGREAWWLLAGRYRGALAWAPFGLLAWLLLWRSSRDPLRMTLAAATLGLAAVAVAVRSSGPPAVGLFAGDPWLAALVPALAVAVPWRVFTARPRGGAVVGLAAAAAAACLWTVPAILASLGAGSTPPLAWLAGGPGTFRALPVELSLLPRLPGYARRSTPRATWVVPADLWYPQENHPSGVWLRGEAEGELFVAAPEPLERIVVTAISPLPHARLRAAAGGDEVLVRFDTEGKRRGVPVVLPAVPAAADFGLYPRSPVDYLYRVRLATSGGWVPARGDPESADRRYLSVFLSFDGEPP